MKKLCFAEKKSNSPALHYIDECTIVENISQNRKKNGKFQNFSLQINYTPIYFPIFLKCGRGSLTRIFTSEPIRLKARRQIEPIKQHQIFE